MAVSLEKRSTGSAKDHLMEMVCCCWGILFWSSGPSEITPVQRYRSEDGNCPRLGAGYPLWLADQWEGGGSSGSTGRRDTELTFYTLHCSGLRKKQGGPLRSTSTASDCSCWWRNNLSLTYTVHNNPLKHLNLSLDAQITFPFFHLLVINSVCFH